MSDDPRAHFTTGGAAYAAFRPDWPEGLVASLAAAAPGRGLAVDVGCGSGQLTARLAPHFDRVMGFDVAPAQLAAATRAPGILYAAALAEALPVATGAAALIAVAQAAHWFDLPAFYAEARRIAAPGAVLALLSYGPPVIDGPLAAPFAALRQVIAPCWPPERAMVEAGYRDIPFPFPDLPCRPRRSRPNGRWTGCSAMSRPGRPPAAPAPQGRVRRWMPASPHWPRAVGVRR